MNEPIYYEDHWFPVFLTKFAPIEVWAVSFGIWVWCRGKLSPGTKRHETIHFLQQKELFFVGQWVLYGLFWLIGRIKYGDGRKAYYQNPFEQEAYDNDNDSEYLTNRKKFAWKHYKI